MKSTQLLAALAVALATAVSSLQVAADGPAGPAELPAGLAAFLEARLLEGDERYREAVEAYDRAMRADPSVVEIRIGYADLLLRLGRPDRAVELLDGADGLDWHGRRVLALALAQLSGTRPERMEEARAALEAVLEERDDDPNLLLGYAQLLHRMGRIDEAEAAIAELRRNRPGSPQLISYHAALLLQLGRKEAAAELFADCATSPSVMLQCRDSAAELLIDLGRPGDAADVLLATLSDNDLDQLMRAAYLLWEADRPGQALEVVDRVLRQVEGSVRARTLRAHLLTATGRFAEASDEIRALLKKNPTDIDLQLAMAWALARQGDIDEARRWLDRAWEPLAANSTSPDAVRCAVTGARVELVADNPIVARDWLARVADPTEAGEEFVRLLGESFRREEDWRGGVGAVVRLQPALSGDARLAAEAIEAEFRLRTSDPRAWQRLRPLLDSDDLTAVIMGLQVLQATERWADAEREAAAALDRFPGERSLRFTRAAALERLGRVDESEAVFLGLLETDPEDASAANYLGYLWADRGVRLDEALALISLAVESEPDNPAYLDSLGWVHYRLGSLEEAEYWLRRAVELDDSDGTVLAHLGEVLVARGRIEDGRRFLLLALDLGCEHPDQVRDLLDGLDDGRQR